MKNVRAPKLMNRLAVLFAAFLPVIVVLAPGVARADGALTNGATHTGVIEIGGLDTWTLTATRNDSITISISEVAGGGEDPDFYPWIRLKAPDGSDLGSDGATSGNWGSTTSAVDVQAPMTGTYTLIVAHYPQKRQTGPGTYVLTMAKTPGPYTISPGDEGGAMINTATHRGTIPVGDIDAWTFRAVKNDSVTISIGEVAGGGEDPGFYPWIRLRGPDGNDLGAQGATAGDWGNTSAEISVRVPLTGIYTLLVADYPYQRQTGPGSYALTGTGIKSIGLSLAAILAVAGSTQGNGAFFRTSIQIHNPRTTPISGAFVFHRAGASGGTNDPSLAYTLNGGQTVDYFDMLPAMGVASGLGSIDIMTSGDPVPAMAARIFSDAGDSGTAGFFLDPVAPEGALQAGESAVIIAPADPAKARLNLGIRSLDQGASFQITIRNKSGALRGTTSKTYAANYFEQVSATAYLGLSLDGDDTITFRMTTGRAIIYGAQTDNKTQDPSVQYAKKSL